MKKLIKLLTLDKEFIFHGQLEDLKKVLRNSRDINYESLSERELKFIATVSWGTLTMTPGPSFRINVRALLTDEGLGRIRVNFRTSIRPEHYFLIVMFIIFFVATILSNESKWTILYLFGIWIIFHAWFQFIYRLQENYLLDKVANRLRLSLIKLESVKKN